MANLQFNIAKGRINELQRRIMANDPANAGLVIVLLKTVESDAALEDRTTLAEVLANNTEADFTGYVRKALTDADLALPSVDNTGNSQSVALPAVKWVDAGGATNNTLVKGIVCFTEDVTNIVPADCIPLTFHDVSETTNGNDLDLNAGTFASSN